MSPEGVEIPLLPQTSADAESFRGVVSQKREVLHSSCGQDMDIFFHAQLECPFVGQTSGHAANRERRQDRIRSVRYDKKPTRQCPIGNAACEH